MTLIDIILNCLGTITLLFFVLPGLITVGYIILRIVLLLMWMTFEKLWEVITNE